MNRFAAIALAAALTFGVASAAQAVDTQPTPDAVLEQPVPVANIFFHNLPALHPAVTGCGELQFIYNSQGGAIGGDAWCAGHTSWRSVAGFAATRYGTAIVTLYGPWKTRYESIVYGTSKYPYARWVSYQTTG